MKKIVAFLMLLLILPAVTAYAASVTSRHFVVRNAPLQPALGSTDEVETEDQGETEEQEDQGETEEQGEQGETEEIELVDDQIIPPADEIIFEDGVEDEQGEEIDAAQPVDTTPPAIEEVETVEAEEQPVDDSEVEMGEESEEPIEPGEEK